MPVKTVKHQKLIFQPMKYTLWSLFVLIALPLSAQRPDASARLERQVQIMTDSLALSSAQSERVRTVLKSSSESMTALREQGRESGDWSSLRPQMLQLRQETDSLLQTTLTTEQWTRWVDIRDAQSSQRRSRRRQRQ